MNCNICGCMDQGIPVCVTECKSRWMHSYSYATLNSIIEHMCIIDIFLMVFVHCLYFINDDNREVVWLWVGK
jgi:hypothetical protein